MRTKLDHLLDKFRYAAYFVLYLIALLCVPFIKQKDTYRDLWIIAERGTDARDNSLHLFRYIKKNHPEINIAYIISKNSKDRDKVAPLGRVIDYRSFEHFLAFAASTVKISTHIMGFAPDIYFFKVLDEKMKIGGKKIFLQHGITMNTLPYLHGDSVSLDLFVCGATAEWNYISETFKHPEGVPQYLGLCRYDALYADVPREKSREILLMPTWRIQIAETVFSDRDFNKTEYFRFYQSLLKNEVLHALLKKYGYTLKFYPHHEMQKYLQCFESTADCIEIADVGALDVQTALIHADIMLTDYSSVFFDFTYMLKPQIYCQFDLETFRSTQYGEGYFSFEQNGFGEVCRTQEEILAVLERILVAGGEMAPLYRERATAFFALRDHNNCERNFRAIQELMN